MMAELLVIGLCLQNKGGCPEASQAYYVGSPELQAMAKRGERLAKENIPQPVISYIFPIVAAGVGKKGTIKLSKHWAIEIDKDKGGTFVFRFSY